jgi:hypothetical protein
MGYLYPLFIPFRKKREDHPNRIKMRKIFTLFTAVLLFNAWNGAAQTVIPNASFESWTTVGNYTNPTSWDTPNEELMAIPFFGVATVTKSTDHYGSGSFSAKLETKHITLPPLDAPGFITLGTLTLDISTMSYTIDGGAPVVDRPTHLKGVYKFAPKGGDSCLVGIGLFKTTGGVRDSVAYGEFSTKDTVPDWTPFSIWIDYDTVITPDTMNIFALSTAQEVIAVAGTVLWLDDFYLDYTVGYDETDPAAGIRVYDDRETRRLMLWFDFPREENISVHLFDMTGRRVAGTAPGPVKAGREVLPYGNLRSGIYILEVIRGDRKMTKKYLLNR